MKVLFIVVLAAAACTALPDHRSHNGNDTPAAEPLVMRIPRAPYEMGPRHSAWAGHAILSASQLEVEFPQIAVDNVGCGDIDSLPRPHRRYYWMATLRYPDSHYPNNHFRSASLEVALP